MCRYRLTSFNQQSLIPKSNREEPRCTVQICAVATRTDFIRDLVKPGNAGHDLRRVRYA